MAMKFVIAMLASGVRDSLELTGKLPLPGRYWQRTELSLSMLVICLVATII